MFKTSHWAGALALCFSLTSLTWAALVGYWPLNEGVGTTAADASGFGNDGTFLGDPQWVAGVFGMALKFDGDDAVVIPNEAHFDFASGSYSFACWIKPDPSMGNWAHWFSKGNDEAFALNRRATSNNVCFGGGDPAPNGDLQGKVNVFDGQWHHIVCVYDADARTKAIHEDGNLTVGPVPYTAAMKTNNRPVNIGGVDRNVRRAEAVGLIDDCGIWDHALSVKEVQEIFQHGIIDVALAARPNPADRATDVPRDATLSWTPGDGADKHDVYLGVNFDDVSNATATMDPSGVYRGRQDQSVHATARLGLGQTYYWRIDEVEADGTTKTGRVWQFTTEPLAYPIRNVTATASSSDASREPQNTVNGSGLDSTGLLHGIVGGGTMWLSKSDDPGPVWIQYEFDHAYKLHQMRVWNYNAEGLNTMYGLKETAVECSLDGNSYEPLGSYEFARAPGKADYTSNTTIDLGNVVAQYVRIDAHSNWSGGLLNQYGLSEVQFFSIPVKAREPNPGSGATDVKVDATLSWRAGREAAQHQMYLSTDEQAVIDGTAPVATVTSPSYACSLDLASTYYWRVDEVNEAETPALLPGEVWNFRTQEFFVVDDFESYTDQPGHCVYETWIDGFVNGTGSVVGLYPDSVRGTFCDTTTFHGGKQSMPLSYDNSSSPFYSETQSTFATLQDWTGAGIQTLTLHFKGFPPAFTESPEGVFTISSAGQDIWGTSDEGRLVYKQLSGDGSIVCRVDSVENTHEWARVGPMIRQRLDANSAHAYVMVAAGDHLEFGYRRTTDATTQGVSVNAIPTPHWVRLTRKGDTLTAAHSADGANWVPVGDDPAASSVTIGMGQNVFVGFAYTSHADVIGVADLSGVATTGSVTGIWQAADLGIEMGNGNGPEPLYVAVEDGSGRSKTINRDDPAATQAHDWQEWNIDLKELSSAGVHLSGIKKMYLGVGNKATPQAGGKGTLYIDDIRLRPAREP